MINEAQMNKSKSRQARGAKIQQAVVRITGALLSLAAKVAPQSAASLLLRLVFTPVRLQPAGRAKDMLAEATVERCIVDGNEITSYIWGSGKRCVLLVHGWSGNAGQMTTIAKSLLAEGCKVIAIDFPGHGISAGTRSSVIHFERVIENANKIYGPFQAIVAHSLGAAAVTYALARGLACERAIFIAPVGSFKTVWSRIQSLFHISSQLVELTRTQAESWLNTAFADIEPARLAQRLPTKLLVIHDRYDKECPIDDSEALVRAWPGATLLATQKLGHTRILFDEGIVQATAQFVASSSDEKLQDLAQTY
jgi:pimeloyl-ACP methyl ester carboxylesterase